MCEGNVPLSRLPSPYVREEAGVERRSPDLGSEGAAKLDERLFAIADNIAVTQPNLPPLTKSGILTTLLIIVFVAALLFLVTLLIAHDQDYLPALPVGQGTIFTALTGVAAFLARTQNASVKAYNERAAE